MKNPDFHIDDRFKSIIWGLFLPLFSYYIYLVYSVYFSIGNSEYWGPVPDYLAFWSAGKMALNGMAAKAYDYLMLTEVEQSIYPNFKVYLPWLNTPVFFLIIAPFAILPFYFSYVLWVLVNSLLCAWVSSRITSLKVAIPAIFCSFPFYAIVANGQSSALAAFLFGMLFLALKNKSLFLSGICIAFFLFKPQLGVLIPFALLAQKEWKIIFSTIIFCIILVGISIFLFSIESWISFFSGDRIFFDRVIINPESHAKLGVLYSIYGLTRYFLNVSYQTGLTLQIISGCCAASVVFFVWRHKEIPLEIKMSTLILMTLFSTIYAYWHDLYIVTIAALLCLRTQTVHNKLKGEGIMYIFAIFLTFLSNIADFQVLYISVFLIGWITFYRFRYFTKYHQSSPESIIIPS